MEQPHLQSAERLKGRHGQFPCTCQSHLSDSRTFQGPSPVSATRSASLPAIPPASMCLLSHVYNGDRQGSTLGRGLYTQRPLLAMHATCSRSCCTSLAPLMRVPGMVVPLVGLAFPVNSGLSVEANGLNEPLIVPTSFRLPVSVLVAGDTSKGRGGGGEGGGRDGEGGGEGGGGEGGGGEGGGSEGGGKGGGDGGGGDGGGGGGGEGGGGEGGGGDGGGGGRWRGRRRRRRRRR